MKKYSKQLSLYLGLLLSGICLWWIFRSVNLYETLNLFRTVKPDHVAIALLATVLSYILRSWRWKYFFPSSPPGFSVCFRCLMLGFFMNNILPARMGEFVRAHIGGRATGQSRTVVLATIAGERLADGLSISLLFAALFSIQASGSLMAEGKELFYVAIFFAVAALMVAILLVARNRVYAVIEKISSRFSGTVSIYALSRVGKFIEGLEPLLRLRNLIFIVTGSCLVWLVELFVYQEVSQAFGQDLPVGFLALFLAAVNFSSLLPAAPGGVGVIEAFATAALVHVGVNKEAALAMVAMQHLIQICVVGFPGGWLFFHELKGRVPHLASSTTPIRDY